MWFAIPSSQWTCTTHSLPVSRRTDNYSDAGGLLTRAGGGAFGNDDRSIDDAIERALLRVAPAGLDVQLVSYGNVHPAMQAIADRWARR